MTKLQVNVIRAEDLKDVERFGKNDPYLVATLDLENKQSFEKTAVKNDAGKEPQWNETLILDNYDPSRHTNLYVTILDQEKLADEPIGFAAIPLNQVNNAQNRSIHGKFNLFTSDGKEEGYVVLEIISLEDNAQARPIAQGQAVHGTSQLDGEHQKKVKALKRKEQAGDVAAFVGFIALAAGTKHALSGKNQPKEA